MDVMIKMLILYRQLEDIERLKGQLPKKYSRHLDFAKVVDAVKRDLLEMSEGLNPVEMQHFVYAATHKFYKRGALQAFNRMVKTKRS